MNYVSTRNITVTSVSGRSVEFVKGKPTFCPPQMHAELIAHGILPEEDIPEPEVNTSTKEPVVPTDREAALFKVFEELLLRNKREEFTASGIPHTAVVVKALGWSGLGVKERDAAWLKFIQDRSAV